MFALLISALAPAVMGAAGPVVYPAHITIRVGESVTLHGYQNAGGLSEGFPYHYEFFSDAPAVATVKGFASGSATTRPDPLPANGDVAVTGIAPGLAHVRAKACCGDLAEITVRPQIRPVEIHAETTRVLLGQPVVLIAVAGYDQPPTFFWYRGQTGRRQPSDPGVREPAVDFHHRGVRNFPHLGAGVCRAGKQLRRDRH